MIHPEEIENSPVIVCPWCLHKMGPLTMARLFLHPRVVCHFCEQPYTLDARFTMKREHARP
jgi:hypothetical protein